jgi:hypothetical protein
MAVIVALIVLLESPVIVSLNTEMVFARMVVYSWWMGLSMCFYNSPFGLIPIVFRLKNRLTSCILVAHLQQSSILLRSRTSVSLSSWLFLTVTLGEWPCDVRNPSEQQL